MGIMPDISDTVSHSVDGIGDISDPEYPTGNIDGYEKESYSYLRENGYGGK